MMLSLKNSKIVVTDLKRKDRVGTVFCTTDPATGGMAFARLTASKKDGRREAVFAHSGDSFSFHTKDKDRWPDAPNPIGKSK